MARARSLNSAERSRIARKAARTRWSKTSGILSLSEIRRTVKRALGERDAEAYLFGSYARKEATRNSDLDIAIVERTLPADWLGEIATLRRAMGFRKSLDLIVIDRASFVRWKREYGTVQHEIFKEGVRIV